MHMHQQLSETNNISDPETLTARVYRQCVCREICQAMHGFLFDEAAVSVLGEDTRASAWQL